MIHFLFISTYLHRSHKYSSYCHLTFNRIMYLNKLRKQKLKLPLGLCMVWNLDNQCYTLETQQPLFEEKPLQFLSKTELLVLHPLLFCSFQNNRFLQDKRKIHTRQLPLKSWGQPDIFYHDKPPAYCLSSSFWFRNERAADKYRKVCNKAALETIIIFSHNKPTAILNNEMNTTLSSVAYI